MPTLDRPLLSAADARRLLDITHDDALVHAGVALLVYAGLRPKETLELRVRDYMPGAEPRVKVGTLRHPRTIRIARSAAGAVDTYLATQTDTEADEPLLVGLRDTLLVQTVRGVAGDVGVDAGVHDFRGTAIRAVLDAGLPVPHIQEYFGLFTALDLAALLPVPEGYDVPIAAVLEAAFA